MQHGILLKIKHPIEDTGVKKHSEDKRQKKSGDGSNTIKCQKQRRQAYPGQKRGVIIWEGSTQQKTADYGSTDDEDGFQMLRLQSDILFLSKFACMRMGLGFALISTGFRIVCVFCHCNEYVATLRNPSLYTEKHRIIHGGLPPNSTA